MPNYTCSDDPDAAVKNKLHATTHEQLEASEARLVFSRITEVLSGDGPTGNFDAEHLKAIHCHLFQDVYEWAGHTRDEKVQLSDGTVASEPLLRKVDGPPFMLGADIPNALDEIAERLRDANYLRDLPREEFAERAADIMADLNEVHPFREGNGRTQRVFIQELAKEAGHELDFSVVSRERMIQASVAANELGDNTKMRRMFDEISDPVRVAALVPAIEFLEQQGFPWNDHYVATMEPGRAVEVTLAGVAGDHFMARTGSEIFVGKTADLPKPQPERGATIRVEPSRWAETELKKPALMVRDVATGIAETLSGFVIGLLAGKSGRQDAQPVTAYRSASDQRAIERGALYALAHIRESIEQGKDLSPADVRNLTPTHLENIRAKGDDYMRNLIDSLERDRKRERDGHDRGR